MKVEMGEYLVGAYLQIVENCDFVNYNVRSPAKGLEGLAEFDVVGINFKENTVYLCEVTTHILGTLYKDYETTFQKIKEKYERQKDYADRYLKMFSKKEFMFWSPVVPKGLVKKLKTINGLELIINEKFTEKVNKLIEFAKKETKNTGNPFFRALQILIHLRGKLEGLC
jgi:hypothetical protein